MATRTASRSTVAFAAGLLLALGVTVPADGAANGICHNTAAPSCDFGDAPDDQIAYPQGPGIEDDVIGQFPSLRTSNGSAHSKVLPRPLRLGTAIDPEGDSKQINIDTGDDGFKRRLTRCKVGKISFTIDTRRLPRKLLTRKHRLYLNFWSDWNFDGDWRDKDTRCGKKRKKGKKSATAAAARGGNPSAKALRRLRSTPVPEWRVQNLPISAALFAGKRIRTITLRVRAGGQVGDFGPNKGQPLAPFECHRAVVTLDERFAKSVAYPDLAGRRGRNDGRGSFGLGETEDYCPFSAPFGPPPPGGGPGEGNPPGGGPGGGDTSKRVGPFALTPCTHGTTYFFDVYIPEDALSPTHQLLMPGTDTPIVPPICPGANETVTVEEYGPGVTAPGGSPPPADDKTYRVSILVEDPTGSASQSFDVEVDWTN